MLVLFGLLCLNYGLFMLYSIIYPPPLHSTALLALAVGIKQKKNVHTMVTKFLSANCSISLFHYDGNVDAWNDLHWSSKAVHVLAHNQTKWWFAKRFLHPDVVSIYDYIFLWDEDLGVTNLDPGSYLQIISAEGLEISQPALDPDLSEVHHRITVRNRKKNVHRRVLSLDFSLTWLKTCHLVVPWSLRTTLLCNLLLLHLHRRVG
ncbi:hypothetical protein ACHQM5_001322 [Ranunculus cassubicifolius]